MPLTDFDVISYEDESVRHVAGFADEVAGVISLPILAGRFVKNVRLRILAAFDDSTAVIVGDGDDDNGFLTTGKLDPTSAGAVQNSSLNDGALAQGKQYDNGGVLAIKLNGTDTSTGIVEATIVYDGYAPVRRGFVDRQNPTYGKSDMETTPWSGDPVDHTIPPEIP